MTKTHLRTTVSTTNPTRTDLKSNPRDQWLTTQHKAWLVSKIFYTAQTSYRLSVQFSPYNTWEIFLADPLHPPKIPQTTQLVGAYCPHLQANKFKLLYNNEYIFSPPHHKHITVTTTDIFSFWTNFFPYQQNLFNTETGTVTYRVQSQFHPHSKFTPINQACFILRFRHQTRTYKWQ